MFYVPNVSVIAALIADPARAVMLSTLLDGRPLPAGELAYASGVTAQTASSHLAKLLAGGLVSVETEGRHRYYRLAGSHIAQALEGLAAIPPTGPVRRKALTADAKALRFARCCYDHLAGQLGVAVTEAVRARGFRSQSSHESGLPSLPSTFSPLLSRSMRSLARAALAAAFAVAD